MNLSDKPTAATAGGSGHGAALPRWQRWLLPAMLGAADLDPDGREVRTLPRSARDWAVDLVIFGSVLIAAAGALWNDHRHAGPGVFALDALLAVPACLSLWVRRQRPLEVVWLNVGLSVISGPAVFTAGVAVFSGAIHMRPRRAIEATVGAVAASAANCAIYTGRGGERSYDWRFLAFWTVLLVAALAFGSFVRVRRQLVLSLHERAHRLQSEQELRVREAQLAERARIAREMHDVLAHRISLVSVHAGALEFNPGASPEEIARAASVIRISARAAQEELREVIGVLRADPEGEDVQPPQPTLANLGGLIEESRHAGMQVTLDSRLLDRNLPVVAGRTAYRVVQEGLTNARKHAPGQPVSILLAGEPGNVLRVEIVNRPAVGEADSAAQAPSEHVGSGTGLVGLAERVALAGGLLEAVKLPEGGFRLSANIPWPPVGDDDGGTTADNDGDADGGAPS
ncbi:MAG TPA: histidine kinase [Solirubrobacteraceae bacterium]|nr:histidine kinase [Solirubrobacteraceae bacterium]